MRHAYSFDDVLLVPRYSPLNSRGEVNVSTQVGSLSLSIPLVSSPMDTVTETEMQMELRRLGGVGVHHRYCEPDILMVALNFGPVAVSPSVGLDWVKEAVDTHEYPVLVMDVAHGDSKPALDFAEQCVKLGAEVWSGNICTADAADRYYCVGVRTFRVGVGSGFACRTWGIAGIGMPQWTAVQDIRKTMPYDTSIVSDGGCRTSGDIVKALAAGADAVMLGRLFAGAEEAPGKRWGSVKKAYRGMASFSALLDNGKELNVEGEETIVDIEGSIESMVGKLLIGVRAGFAYLGAKNIKELRDRAEFIQVK